MRYALALCLLPGPLLAWEFSPSPICTLSEDTEAATLVITYDQSVPEYALTITLKTGTWADSPGFGMDFAGPRPVRIGTARHVISGDRRTLSVVDRGFGNVLDGLEFNIRATAFTQSQSVSFSLESAAPAVEAFRACPKDVLPVS